MRRAMTIAGTFGREGGLPFISPAARLAHDATAVLGGAAAASDAAANNRARSPIPTERTPTSKLRERIDLIGYEPGAGAKLRAAPHFREVFAAPVDRARTWTTDGGGTPEDVAARERRDVVRALGDGRALEAREIGEELERATWAGEIAAVKLSGELVVAFDESETLRAWIAAASGVAGADRRVADACRAANDAIGCGFTLPIEVIEAHLASLRGALAHASRPVDAACVEAIVERHLLEHRTYRARHALGARRVYASLFVAGAPAALAAYLPERIAAELPGFARFSVHVACEIRPPQEARESGASILVFALARALSSAVC